MGNPKFVGTGGKTPNAKSCAALSEGLELAERLCTEVVMI